MDGQAVPVAEDGSAVAGRAAPASVTAPRDRPEVAGGFPLPLVVVAASAGGIQAIGTVLGGLPGDFRGAVLVVQHLDPHHPSHLVDILVRRCRLPVQEASDRAVLRPGTVYLAPPDRHVMIDRDAVISLDASPPVHHLRPSADVLFASAAAVGDGRVIAVVLSGTGTDGADGVRAVKRGGGMVVVQDPGSSEFPGMPSSAVATGVADLVLPVERIGGAVAALAAEQGG